MEEGVVYLPAGSGVVKGAKNMENAKRFIDFITSPEIQNIYGTTITNRPVMGNFDEKCINEMEVSKRNIGMVFQNYAIFPHYTVQQNVEFGLKNRKLPKEEIQKTTDEFLKLTQIQDYKNRMPESLSGGQQQRVALARALVIKPDVLLMDEPLSNLDAKLRLEMRQVIRNLQKEVGITTVYVTHDQDEAMAISDRIAVMKDGVIQHVGTPQEIYHRPANIFVATFIGSTNLIEGEFNPADKIVKLPDYELRIENLPCDRNTPVILSIRPEDFSMTKKDEGGIKSTISDSLFLGLNTHYFVELPGGQYIEIIHESDMNSVFQTGDTVYLNIKGKAFLRILIILSSMSAPFIGAYSWILLLGRRGVITLFFRDTIGLQFPSIYGFTGILIVLTLQLYPLIFLYASGVYILYVI
jgi:iron(III) transport system ATP-binding protein